MARSPHQVLGVKPGASQEELLAAYRRQRHRTHPDKNPNDAEAAARFHEVKAAYESLTRPKASSPDPSSSSSASSHSHFHFESDPDFGSLFDHLFSRGRGFGFSVSPPIIIRVPWSLSLSGGQWRGQDSNGVFREFLLPEGVASGDRFEVTLSSNHRQEVEIRVETPEGVTRKGNDIFATLTLSAWRAALGGTHQWSLWNGDVTIKIPPGTQPGTLLRLSGKGAVHPNNRRRGDLFAQVEVEVPKKLTAAQRRQLANWLGDPRPSPSSKKSRVSS